MDNLKRFAHLTMLVYSHHITCGKIDMETVEADLNNLMRVIQAKIRKIEEADKQRST